VPSFSSYVNRVRLTPAGSGLGLGYGDAAARAWPLKLPMGAVGSEASPFRVEEERMIPRLRGAGVGADAEAVTATGAKAGAEVVIGAEAGAAAPGMLLVARLSYVKV
jgi:hypothetical protein